MKTFRILFASFIILYTSFSSSQALVDTTWHGNISLMGSKLGIIVEFWSQGGMSKGVIDIPEQGQSGLALTGVVFQNPRMHFELQAGPGLAVFEGIYYIDSISGTFTQAGMNGTFTLKKGLPEKIESTLGDVPYKQEEITFTNGENTFAGTFTYPSENTSGVKGFPAVILITGSGPQDRNEEILGFKIFEVIADHLTRNGIAVLRYDDRGVGGTKGKSVSESTTMDFASDVVEAVNYLKSRGDVSSIGLLGHSEGGIVAPIVSVKSPDVQFIILMAGTGVKGIDIIKEQSALIMKADNSTKKEIDGYLKLMDAIYDAVKKNESLDNVKAQIANSILENFDALPKEQKKNVKDKEKYAVEMAEMTIAQFNNPWMRYFLAYDPSVMLTGVKCPVLVLFGEKDLQVPPKQNENPIVDALTKGGNQEFRVEIFPNANHLFQEAVTGSPGEYATLKKEFVPGFLDTITDWIKVKVQ
jgi:pimeloyl-ACP methyl ester carboxylesterase